MGKKLKRVKHFSGGIFFSALGTLIAFVSGKWLWDCYIFLPYIQRNLAIDCVATLASLAFFVGLVCLVIGMMYFKEE